MQDRRKPTNAIASVCRRSFRPGFHGAVWSSVVIMGHEKQILGIDSVRTDVTALAMVRANVCEAPDTVLKRLQPIGL